MKIIKVRNKKTGLFSKGGTYPHGHKTGKIWTEQTIRSHLSMVVKAHKGDAQCLDDWEVVEFEIKELDSWPAELYRKKDHYQLMLLKD